MNLFQILKQQKGKLSKNNPEDKKEEEPMQSILFSDRDFDQHQEKDDFWD